MCVRRRPTLPQPLGCSTIGAERLNFRVRYGTGCFPFRYGRRNSFNPHKHAPTRPGVAWGGWWCLLVGNCLVDANQPRWLCVFVVCARCLYTSFLHVCWFHVCGCVR